MKKLITYRDDKLHVTAQLIKKNNKIVAFKFWRDYQSKDTCGGPLVVEENKLLSAGGVIPSYVLEALKSEGIQTP